MKIGTEHIVLADYGFRMDRKIDRHPTTHELTYMLQVWLPDESYLTVRVEPHTEDAELAKEILAVKLADLFADMACRLEKGAQEELEGKISDIAGYIEETYSKKRDFKPGLG